MDRAAAPRRAAILVVAAGLLVVTAGAAPALSAPSSGPYWAAVGSDGAVIASSTGVSVGAHRFTGKYDLTFPQDVSRCAIVATSGVALDTGVIGQASSGLEIVIQGGQFSAPNRVSVLETRAGASTDYSFSVVAYC
jgi:hypothetical protein